MSTFHWTKRLLTGMIRASIPTRDRAQPAHVAADTTPHCSPTFLETNVCYVESGQPQVLPVDSSPTHRPREDWRSGHLFFWSLQQEVHLADDFVVHPIHWERCPLAAADPYARAWITLQSHRGLAYNTLDAYSRGLERYFRFLAQLHSACAAVTRAEVGLYLASLQADAHASRTQRFSSY